MGTFTYRLHWLLSRGMGVVSRATRDIASVFLEFASPGAEAGVVGGKQAEGRSP